MRPPRSPLAWALALAPVPAAGCFDAGFMLGQVCSSNADCGDELECELNLCGGQVAPQGPLVELPRPVDVPASGPAAAELLVEWSGINLDDPETPSSSYLAARGYLELRVDDGPPARLVEGGVSGRAPVEVPLPALTPGLHFAEVTALDLEGDSFSGDQARAVGWFWVHDGTPGVQIIAPTDGTEYVRYSDPLDIQLSVADFGLVSSLAPDATPADPAAPSGRVALFAAPSFPVCQGSECTADDAVATYGASRQGGGHSVDIDAELGLDDQKTDDGVVRLTAALVGPDGALLRIDGDPVAHSITLRFPPEQT